jgi:hypothetical protein
MMDTLLYGELASWWPLLSLPAEYRKPARTPVVRYLA